MARLRIEFARVVFHGSPHDFDVLSFVVGALQNYGVHRIGSDGSTILAFLDVQRQRLLGREWVTCSVAYSQGRKYPAIDASGQHLTNVEYPTPPLRGDAALIINSDGFIVLESMAAAPLRATRVLEHLSAAIRAHSPDRRNIGIEMLGLDPSYDAMSNFIGSLSILRSIRLDQLRHSNPREKSKYLDDAADAHVTSIEHSSEHPEGIDRSHPEFQNLVAHADRYARIARISGISDGNYRELESDADGLGLAIDARSPTLTGKPMGMAKAFAEIASALRRRGWL